MKRRVLWVVVWLLGVAGLWWLLPPTPRLTWHPPADTWTVGLSADGVVVVARGNPPFLAHMSPSGSPDEGVARGPVEAWDITAGRRLWAYGGPDDRLHVWYGPAAEVVVVHRIGPPSATLRLDPRTGAERPAASPPALFDGRPAGRYAPGRRVAFVYVADPDKPAPSLTIAYDVATGRRLYDLPPRWVATLGLEEAVFSPDGRVMAEIQNYPDEQNRPSELVVREVVTGRELCRCPCADTYMVPVAITSDGSRLINPDQRLIDTATGRVIPYQDIPDESSVTAMVTDDGKRLVVVSESWLPGDAGGELRVDWYDPATGQPDQSRRQVLARGEDWGLRVYAPDFRNYANGRAGRWLLVEASHEPPPSDRYLWLNRQAPWLFPVNFNGPLGRTAHMPGGFARVIDVANARLLADLPIMHDVRGVATDGRSVVTEFYDGRPGVAVWGVPPRPALWLMGLLAAGWALLLFALARWQRRRAATRRLRSHRPLTPAGG